MRPLTCGAAARKSPRACRVALSFVLFGLAALWKVVTFEHSDVAAGPHRSAAATGGPGSNSTFTSYFKTAAEDDDFEIVTTNFGWTTPDRFNFSRRKISGEFFDAVLSHPRYNASAYGDLEANPDPSRRVVIFLDVDTCIEGNYPVYSASFSVNSDWTRHEREKPYEILDRSCGHIRRAAESPVLRANRHSRLLLLDCGNGPLYRLMDVCNREAAEARKSQFRDADRHEHWGDVLDNPQVIIAYYGVARAHARWHYDIGLPPPAVRPVRLLPHERYELGTLCRRRHYTFSFEGQGGYTRDALLTLDNGDDVHVRLKDPKTYWSNHADGSALPQEPNTTRYEDMLRHSTFGGAPRGDCLWSYRFTEVMSAGAVPVLYSNAWDWLPPFSSGADRDRLVDWSKCALFVPPRMKNETVRVIRSLSEGDVCEMQRCALAFWDEFASTRAGWLRGLLRWVNSDPVIVNASKEAVDLAVRSIG